MAEPILAGAEAPERFTVFTCPFCNAYLQLAVRSVTPILPDVLARRESRVMVSEQYKCERCRVIFHADDTYRARPIDRLGPLGGEHHG